MAATRRNKQLLRLQSSDDKLSDASLAKRNGDMRLDTTLAIQDASRTQGRYKRNDVAASTKLRLCFPASDTMIGHASTAAREQGVAHQVATRVRNEGAEGVSKQRDNSVCDMVLKGADVWVGQFLCFRIVL